MAKQVLMFATGRFVPIRQGSDKFIHDVAKFLNKQEDIELTLAIKGSAYPGFEKDYAGICDHVEWVPTPGRFSVFRMLNALTARCGISVFGSLGFALAMRRRLSTLAKNADCIIINYATWFALLPRSLRKAKGICITTDILFYRRASINGTDTWLKRLSVALTRIFELKVLKGFRKIAVLGDYEKDMLAEAGFDTSNVITTGMPIEVQETKSDRKLYDFITISGAARPNVEGVKIFLKRIAPLLAPRKITYALIGNICNATALTEPGTCPDNVELVKLGFADNLSPFCAQSRIGVAIVPAGSGIKVKTVEMALRGLPILTSNHGAEGIPLTASGHINIDNASNHQLQDTLSHWLNDPAEAERIGKEQGEKVATAFAPATVLAELLNTI